VTPEGKIKAAIRKVLDSMDGLYYFMPVQMGMGSRTLDFLVCYKGKFFGIEAKAPGEKPTKLQDLCMRKIRKSGGECMVIDKLEDIFALKHWLETHADGEK
jgi:hypothetical protein